MLLLSEEKRKKLLDAGIRVPHVNNNCIGCSACAMISPLVFEMSDDGLSVVQDIPNYEDNNVDESISACPVEAITWQKKE